MSRPSSRSRLVKAVAIVGLLMVAAPASNLLGRALSGSSDARTVDGGLNAAGLVAGDDPFTSLERLEELAGSATVALPRYFEEEIGLPERACEVRVSSNGSIISYVVEDAVESVHQLVSKHMIDAGWSEVDLGAVQGSTYLKESGSCRWSLATFTEVGSATSVVFRCVVT